MQLLELYFKNLTERFSAEKKYAQLYNRLNKAVHTDELKKLFAPSETFVEEHIERLALILKSHKLNKPTSIGEDDQYIMNRSVSLLKKRIKSGLEKDISIIQLGTLLYQMTIGHYEQMLQMAKVLEFEIDITFIEQSLKENKNNYGYLLQISANVVYVQVK
jgi:ferritin-like metal-binding protein YciE